MILSVVKMSENSVDFYDPVVKTIFIYLQPAGKFSRKLSTFTIIYKYICIYNDRKICVYYINIDKMRENLCFLPVCRLFTGTDPTKSQGVTSHDENKEIHVNTWEVYIYIFTGIWITMRQIYIR